jgi:hypothetical protein
MSSTRARREKNGELRVENVELRIEMSRYA